MFNVVGRDTFFAPTLIRPSQVADVVMSSPTVIPGVSSGFQLSVSWTGLLTCPKQILVATELTRGSVRVGPLYVGVSLTRYYSIVHLCVMLFNGACAWFPFVLTTFTAFGYFGSQSGMT